MRADSGFCRQELMAWCENNGVDYVFGLAQPAAAEENRILPVLSEQEHRRTGKSAREFSRVPLPARGQVDPGPSG